VPSGAPELPLHKEKVASLVVAALERFDHEMPTAVLRKLSTSPPPATADGT